MQQRGRKDTRGMKGKVDRFHVTVDVGTEKRKGKKR
jgi:hypothetical protein